MKQRDFVFSELSRRIVQLELPPGAPLREIDIAEMLGVSRTPVREALQKLVREGLAILRGRSAYVAELTLQDVIELFQLREAIEPYATALCARRKPAVFGDLAERFDALLPELRALGSDAELAEADEHAPARRYYHLLDALDEALMAHCGNSQIVTALDQAWTKFHRLRLYSRRSRARIIASAEEHLRISRAVSAGDADAAIESTVQHLLASCRNVLDQMIGDPQQTLHQSVTLGRRAVSTEISGYLADTSLHSARTSKTEGAAQ